MGKGSLIVYKILAWYTLLSFSVLTHSAPETALITQIPGFSGNLPSKHYSGYVSIFLHFYSFCLQFIAVLTKSQLKITLWWLIMAFLCFLKVCDGWWKPWEEPLLLLCWIRRESIQGSCGSVAQWWTRMLQLWWFYIWARYIFIELMLVILFLSEIRSIQ